MKKWIIFSIAASATLISCNESIEKKLLWSDEFEYSGPPDSTKWSYNLGDGCPNCGWGNSELEYYTKDIKNARVEDGMLIIEAHKDSLDGKAYTSSRMVSKQKGDWLYGRIEVKAKLPKGIGTWPAIWMLPTDWEYGPWPASGEIDIMEHVGYDPGIIHGTIQTEAYNIIKQTQREETIAVTDVEDAFHVYAIDWSENRINLYVDDKLYNSFKRYPKDDFKQWPFDQRFHLILNVAVGGTWGGSRGVDESIWPQRMVVDYVRVYQL